ncbi:MAG: hypothetical protein COA86_07270 [Kangiella sp.]|nr:MAG: hypothetical protein COA86_07270 [Kangiella sp.]
MSESYIKLVLALGEQDTYYVDAYYGDEKFQIEIKKNPLTLKQIVKQANILIQTLKLLNPHKELIKLRRSYLQIQLSSLMARASMVSGTKKLSFDEQSRLLYNTEAPHFKFSDFDKTLEKLNQLLPGSESLPVRANRFKDQFIIPKDKLSLVFDIAIKECRNRTQVFIELLPNENFTLEYVKDKPWSGYNWYKGNAFSLIQINEELPIYISRAIDLGCHEGYPGHHTYNALLEANLVKKLGWKEFTVYPLFSPQSLIAEGSANYGIELAFPGDEKIEFEKAKLFPIAGINPNLADDYVIFSKLTEKLNYAGNEIARLYLNGEIEPEKAIELFQKYTLASKQKAKQRLKFWDTYGAYVINYNWGKDLVKNWVEAGTDQSNKGKWKRFAKLLASPRLPSTLKD